MSRRTCGCWDVETSVQKLQSLLAMELHLDEEMDELERLYQLDQLKYDWLLREGHPDLCDVIKQQMQKTESLLSMYTPMLQDTCAEKEAHINHILTVQRQRRSVASWVEQQQHQHLQQQHSQEETHGVFPDWRSAQNGILHYHSMLHGSQMPSRHSQYLSGNIRSFTKNLDNTKGDQEKVSVIVDGQEKDKSALDSQLKNCRTMKKRCNREILHKSTGWRKLLGYKFSSIQKHYNSSNISLPYFKAKSIHTRTWWARAQCHRKHSFSKAIRRNEYQIGIKNVKLSHKGVRRENISEENSSCGELLVPKSTAQLMKGSLSGQKVLNTKRATGSTVKNLFSRNYATDTDYLRNNSKSLNGNLPSIPKPHQKQKAPSQAPSSLLGTIPADVLHKNRQYAKLKQPFHQSHGQATLNATKTENPNRERRNNSPSLNNTGLGLLHKFDVQIVTVSDIASDEDNSLNININNYVSPNWPDGFHYPETDCARE